MEEKAIDRIFAGSIVELPPVSSKIVRIFTSSTFTDTQLERNTLMAEVYPKIKEYCKEKHGLEFQVVDMRWGIRDEATDDHMTTELCMREIKNCQRSSNGPNFVIFLCQKYGYRPIPTIIDGSELLLLKESLKNMGVDVYLIDLWYKKDSNAVPSVYILQPISSILVNFLNKSAPKLQSQDQATWWQTLTDLQKLLRKAALRCNIDGTLSNDDMHNYFMSVTEREVINGILNTKNVKQHCVAYLRTINNINLQNIKKASNFIDILNRAIDIEAQNLMEDERERLIAKMESENAIIEKFTIEWMGREGVSLDTHLDYLSSFLRHFYQSITKLVDRAMKKEDTSSFGRIVTELLQHLNSCKSSVEVFYGREDSLIKGKEYLLGPSDKPLVLFGSGGSGKTSLLSKLAAASVEWLKEASGAVPLLLVRYMGTTPDSSAVTPLLISICQQISFNFNLLMEDIPDDLVPLTGYFKELLNYATPQRPFLIFLDSIEQLAAVSGAGKLSWLPSKLPNNIRVVLSCVLEPSEPEISKDYILMRRILEGNEHFIEVEPLGEDLATEVISQWLIRAGRDLSKYQWRIVYKAFAQCTLPIFVKLVFGEIIRWKSYTKPDDTQLAYTVNDSIFKLFDRVEFQHGPLLVSHALAYITASKSGLSESELEDLISLDDIVLDDVYQYHMPPTRRIPPLLWTRIRNDLPNYFNEREADSVSVINWFHRQFREAALFRYFDKEIHTIFYHSSIADYFLGGGKPKPFRYTEMQRFRFNLKSRDGESDRKVPLQPLIFHSKDGRAPRYNLRKFGELPFHLLRSKRYEDLFSHVLFNYQWICAKICTSLQSCLSDYEDALQNIENKEWKREIILVSDALRLGGATLLLYPKMLGPQLIGRLIPEMKNNPNVTNLIKQCDTEGVHDCALVPAYHCMHTPGSALKYCLEGHKFAVFDFVMTSDRRFLISVSNVFIIYDVNTGDLTRLINLEIEGILQEICISPDNKLAAAYSNNDQIILLNLLTNDYIIKQHASEVTGLFLLNSHMMVYGESTWVIYNIRGEIEEVVEKPAEIGDYKILSLNFESLLDYYMVFWSGNIEDSKMLIWFFYQRKTLEPFHFHGAFVMFPSRKKMVCCIEEHNNNLVEFNFDSNEPKWVKGRIYNENEDEILQLYLTEDEDYIISTILNGFKALNISSEESTTYLLPKGVRNICSKLNKSNSCIFSKENIYALAGVRKLIYIWDAETGELLKQLDAHFERIIKLVPVLVGNWNSIVTCSIDKTIKVWTINNIFEKIHLIDRHELQIDSISVSTETSLCAVATRSAVGIWDLRTGKLAAKLADSALGAIVSHTKISLSGMHVISAESGNVLVWSSEERGIIFKEEQMDIQELFFMHGDQAFLTASKMRINREQMCLVIVRSMPSGDRLYSFEYPFKTYRSLVLTSDATLIVCPGFSQQKDTFFVYSAKCGKLLHKIQLKYDDFKDYINIVAIPKRATQVGIIDSDKGNILDVKSKKFIRSVYRWNGKTTQDGKYGLFAPGRGGLELIDLKNGKTITTYIPKVAEGIFTTICCFNKTDEYVIYYHAGRKTIRVFRSVEGNMIANYRVQADLSSIESTEDGKALIIGTVDGYLTVLVLADPQKEEMQEYLKNLPSRNEEVAQKEKKRKFPFNFRRAAKLTQILLKSQRMSRNKSSDSLLNESNNNNENKDLNKVNSVNESSIE